MASAPEPNDAVLQRLGSAEGERRQVFEQLERPGNLRQSFRRACLAGVMRLAPSLLVTGLRFSGLYRHGRRQFQTIRVVHNEVRLPHLPQALDGFTLLQLSDLHLDLAPALVEVIAATIRDLRYDVCVMTGDFRNLTIGPWQAAVAETLRLGAHLRAPAYAVLGNHDLLSMVPPLEAGGIRFLLNESVRLEHNGSSIHLAGIDHPAFSGTDGLRRALRQVPHSAPCILLAHAPAVHAAAGHHRIDLVLAGHTHGGQICLPGGWVLWRNDPSPRRLLRGPWQVGVLRGYTSPGTGACGVPIRFNCPPEVTLHILRHAPATTSLPA